MAILINGKGLAEKVCARVKTEAEGLPRRPCLAAVLVGNDPASEIYVRNKERDCVKCSIDSRRFDLPESVSERELLELIARLNADDAVTASPCTILPIRSLRVPAAAADKRAQGHKRDLARQGRGRVPPR